MWSMWTRAPSVARVVAVLALASWAMAAGMRHSDRPVVGALLGAIATLGLLPRSRLALVALALVFATLIALDPVAGFSGPDDPFIVAIAWASFRVGRHAPLRAQPWAAAATLFFLSINLTETDSSSLPADLVFPALFTGAPWLAGLALQLHAARSEKAGELARDVIGARQSELRKATSDERLRVARELHDVAAHHMSAVSIEAQVLRARAERGDHVTGAELAAIESTARQALDELRKVLGVLRVDDAGLELSPQPSLSDLPQLIEDCRRAGQAIECTVDGNPRRIPDGVSLAAYRITQEALTNARRHGSRGAATVTLTWLPVEIRLTVRNAVGKPKPGFRSGNGVRGMHERAELYGGSLSAGPDRAGMWVVEACLPTPAP